MKDTTAILHGVKADINDRLDQLHEEFKPLSIEDRLKRLRHYFTPQQTMMTSSFGTKSVFLLHHIFKAIPEQHIYFLDTKYHFKETLEYKETLRKSFNLRLTYVYPDKKQNDLTTSEQWWLDHPRMCCTANKIAPLEPYIHEHKVWISGLMSHQTEHRSRFRIFEPQGDILKFYPIIDSDNKAVEDYINELDLPRHPLEKLGYGSVGCTHCTLKGHGRSGRWQGTTQKECGIHLNYFYKKQEL